MNIVTLKDDHSGSSAKILVDLGFNAFSFRPVIAGHEVEAIWAAADFAAGTARPSGSGIPLLFPFPGRLRGTSFSFEGRNYTLKPGDAFGNAIHGFVFDRPWRVIEKTPSEVLGEFQASVDDASILEHWPSDFRIRVRYKLDGATLRSEIEIHNPGSGRLPFGLGTHPYFRVPLGNGDGAEKCRVTVPVHAHWPLVNMLPTGEKTPISGAMGLAEGVDFAKAQFDDVFSELDKVGGQYQATIVDPTYHRTLTLTFSEGFNTCVVYTPGHREAICIEPYTCLPDAYTLEERGVPTGLRVLDPGATARYWVEMRVS